MGLSGRDLLSVGFVADPPTQSAQVPDVLLLGVGMAVLAVGVRHLEGEGAGSHLGRHAAEQTRARHNGTQHRPCRADRHGAFDNYGRAGAGVTADEIECVLDVRGVHRTILLVDRRRDAYEEVRCGRQVLTARGKLDASAAELAAELLYPARRDVVADHPEAGAGAFDCQHTAHVANPQDGNYWAGNMFFCPSIVLSVSFPVFCVARYVLETGRGRQSVSVCVATDTAHCYIVFVCPVAISLIFSNVQASLSVNKGSWELLWRFARTLYFVDGEPLFL